MASHYDFRELINSNLPRVATDNDCSSIRTGNLSKDLVVFRSLTTDELLVTSYRCSGEESEWARSWKIWTSLFSV
jgi:hypothetical protein